MATNKQYYIKQWRLIRDMTQQELAEKIKVRRATINDLERGRHRPSEETLAAIMRALDLTPAQIARDPFARYAVR